MVCDEVSSTVCIVYYGTIMVGKQLQLYTHVVLQCTCSNNTALTSCIVWGKQAGFFRVGNNTRVYTLALLGNE